MFQWLPLTCGGSVQHNRDMADDPNAKPPPHPEIIVEGAWPHFLRQPTDPSERARRAQQAVDEQREHERKRCERLRTNPAREEKSARRRRKVEIVMKVAATAAVKTTPHQVAKDMLEQINKHLKLDRLDEMTHDAVYRIVRVPSNWSRLTSLRKR
jgi:hypothetical protein